jgi:ankyrin repeat protein
VNAHSRASLLQTERIHLHDSIRDTVSSQRGEFTDEQIVFVELLVGGGQNLNKVEDSSRSPLMTAALAGYDDVVKLLTEAGADVNLLDDNK